MKAQPQFASIFLAACVSVFLSPPAPARPANPPQDQGTTHTQSGQRDKKQKARSGPARDVGKGSEDVGKGTLV